MKETPEETAKDKKVDPFREKETGKQGKRLPFFFF